MSTYPVWANQGSANTASPSSTLINSGWTAEQPAYEHFNWLFNRIDTRLSAIESPAEAVRSFSVNRVSDSAANSTIVVPEYTPGQGTLRVFFDGFLCQPKTGTLTSAEAQYEEVAAVSPATTSTTIKLLQAVPKYVSIIVEVIQPTMAEAISRLSLGESVTTVSTANQVITINPETASSPVIDAVYSCSIAATAPESDYVKRIPVVFKNSTGSAATTVTIASSLEALDADRTLSIAVGSYVFGEINFIAGHVIFRKFVSF